MSKVKVSNLVSAYEFTMFLSKLEERSIEIIDGKTNNKLLYHLLPSQKIVQIKDNFNFKTLRYTDNLILELSYDKSKIKVTDENSGYVWSLVLKTVTPASKQIKITYDNNNSIISIIQRACSKLASSLP